MVWCHACNQLSEQIQLVRDVQAADEWVELSSWSQRLRHNDPGHVAVTVATFTLSLATGVLAGIVALVLITTIVNDLTRLGIDDLGLVPQFVGQVLQVVWDALLNTAGLHGILNTHQLPGTHAIATAAQGEEVR